MGNQETDIVQRIRLAIGATSDVRVWRNNSCSGWGGELASKTPDRAIILNPHPIQAGLCAGSSDLIGFKSVRITPDMVGRTVAVFMAIEVKTTTGKVTEDQNNFLNFVRSQGGISGVARSPEDAVKITGGV